MWTSHGHQIIGTIAQDPIASDRPKVARCGGPQMCKQCASEASKAQKEAGRDEFGELIEKSGDT
jgi:hypothetical protein